MIMNGVIPCVSSTLFVISQRNKIKVTDTFVQQKCPLTFIHSPLKNKNPTIDIVKGMAIILVVYGHVIEHGMAPQGC